ncbi:hypothetical protein MRX96_027619 [Rhipicephalus microplus]
MDLVAHPFFSAVMDHRGRGFRCAFFLGALAATVVMTAHGATRPKTGLPDILDDLEKCHPASSATATTRGATVVKSGIHKRALCPSRPSFDFDHLRIPEHQNLTTVECLCQDKLCLPLNDYKCTAVQHSIPVEYKNGTRTNVALTVACVCARKVSRIAYHGPTQTD